MSIEWHSSREFWMGESEPPAKEKYIGVQPNGKAAAFDAATKGSNPFIPAISNNSNYRLRVDAYSKQ